AVLAAGVLRHKLLEDVRCAVASVAALAASAPPKPEAAVHPDPLEGELRFLRVSSLVNTVPARGSGLTSRPCTSRGGADVDRSPRMSGSNCLSGGALPGHSCTVSKLPYSATVINVGIAVTELDTQAADAVLGCETRRVGEGVARCGDSATGGSAGSGFSPSRGPEFRIVRDSAWEDDGEDQAGEAVQCGVCLELPVVVMPPSCGHGICGGCAEQLCAGVKSKPLTCPFCRRLVPAFVPWERPRFKTQSFWGP
ncbi:hypothetical protein Vafri_3559, partial [Volvox africanus]